MKPIFLTAFVVSIAILSAASPALAKKKAAFEQISREIQLSPTPAPGWMRHGAPVGSLVYLNGNDDLSVMLGRVESAGGKILRGKTQISPDIGYMAVFEDSEGNRIALHSQN